MSRLWSRFGFRSLSVALLLVAVLGGVYAGHDQLAQRADDAALADGGAADQQQLLERAASRTVATSRQRAAQREAAERAAEAAKAAAQRARRVDDAATKKKAEDADEAKTVPFTGPIPKSCDEYSGNRAIGCALTLARGFTLRDMACLNKLWNHESGWNHKASNNSTGAYGIPQALPGSKMASAGADWKTNPATQIKWGLSYIKGRYGTPCDAWATFQSQGWY